MMENTIYGLKKALANPYAVKRRESKPVETKKEHPNWEAMRLQMYRKSERTLVR